MKTLAAKKPMIYDTPEEKIKAFEAAFGDLKILDIEFIKGISRVK